MLKIDQDNWRSRWLHTDGSDFIHRVAEATWGRLPLLDDPSDVFEPNGLDGEMIEAMGTTLCGLSGRLVMPGIFSRMGAIRCPECCKKMGIAEGKGNPFNEGILEPGDVKKPRMTPEELRRLGEQEE